MYFLLLFIDIQAISVRAYQELKDLKGIAVGLVQQELQVHEAKWAP